jgi:asparagine synthase (glutamine-hydrolysing)
MCGILGIATPAGARIPLARADIERMRDTMAHRGPDGRGLWDSHLAAATHHSSSPPQPHIILAHRRLAVLDTSAAAAQPMLTSDGRYALVYSGELYNEPELRQRLIRAGACFRTRSDTETVLHALLAWGHAALPQFRGMYALGFYDTQQRTLLLARDPLGIKPLYYHLNSLSQLIFASEIPAILAHPHIAPRPDFITISAYLSTIRTVLGARTLFCGISTLRPGESILIDLSTSEITLQHHTHAAALPAPTPITPDALRLAIEDSLDRHLRADVPLCCLLSGGLDSSIIATLALRRLGSLRTYCSGAAAICLSGQHGSDDFAFARRMATRLGTQHTDVPITPRLFTQHWGEMIDTLGTPLSTPNEVAIYELARRLRHDGHIVALSGEGADELFAGYPAPMLEAHAYISDDSPARPSPGLFQLLSTAWIAPHEKATILSDHIWRGIERDDHLVHHYESEFAAAAGQRSDDSALQAHLRFQRRLNLAGLLQRLDTATMLASVEGRTPFADWAICQLAESLPISCKYAAPPHGSDTSAASTHADTTQTKRILRQAFAGELPDDVLTRSKSSFPLPFQEWMTDHASGIGESALARELFTPSTLQAIAAHPARLWRMAWPAINIALWSRRWWQ